MVHGGRHLVLQFLVLVCSAPHAVGETRECTTVNVLILLTQFVRLVLVMSELNFRETVCSVNIHIVLCGCFR